MPGGTLLKGGKELRKKIVTMAIIAAMSGAMVTSVITCSASTFADAVNSLGDSFDANKTEEENEAEEESSSLAEDVDDNTDATNEDVADETSETENNETSETLEASETTASEDTSETSEEKSEDESQPTATPEAEKKDTKKKKKWFSITIWDILKQLSWAMVLMVIPGYCIFKRSKK